MRLPTVYGKVDVFAEMQEQTSCRRGMENHEERGNDSWAERLACASR